MPIKTQIGNYQPRSNAQEVINKRTQKLLLLSSCFFNGTLYQSGLLSYFIMINFSMTTRKQNRDLYERTDKPQRDDIVGEDLSQFVQAYLKSLLLYNPHPSNLLLPPTSPEDAPDIDNLYELLNQITNSTDVNVDLSFNQPQNKANTKSIIEDICEEEKAPQLNEDSVNTTPSNLLLSMKRLVLKPAEVNDHFEELSSKHQFCWG